jgi:hypothetical protein
VAGAHNREITKALIQQAVALFGEERGEELRPGLEERAKDEAVQPTRNGHRWDAQTSVMAAHPTPPEAKAFPVEAMPARCRPLIKEATASFGCAPELVALPMLATLSSAIGTSRVVEIKGGWREWPALFVAVVAPPGAMKTPAAKVAKKPAFERQRELGKCYLEEKENFQRETCEWEVERRDAQKASEPAPEQPEALRLFASCVDSMGAEVLEPGFPRRLEGVWSKLRGYLARLSLIRAVCRSVQSTASEERVEREDVADAAKLLVYFKVHARRVFAEIGSPDPLEGLGSALKALIEDQGGKLEATATEIYHALQEAGCEVLPAAPRELSRAVSTLATRSPALRVSSGHRGKQRVLRLKLRKNSVGIYAQAHDTSPGYSFVAAKKGAGQDGPMIVDNLGRLVWFSKDRYATDSSCAAWAANGRTPATGRMGHRPVGFGLPHPEADTRPAGLRRAAHLVGGELRRSPPSRRAGSCRTSRQPLRPSGCTGLLAHGGAGCLARGAFTQVREPGSPDQPGKEALR